MRPSRALPDGVPGADVANGRLAPFVFVLLVVFVAALGLLPHLLFSHQLGELRFFKSAYDEDTYGLWLLEGGGPWVPSRLLSRVAMRGLFEVSGHSWDVAYVAADVVFPVVVALTAWVLAGLLARPPVVRLLLTIGVLFAQELFSLGCSAIWRYGISHIRSLVAALAPGARGLVPDSTTSYLSIFRTPEPQVSLIVFLGILAILVRLATPEGRRNRHLLAVLLLGNALLGLTYLFLAVSLVVLEIVYSAVLSLIGKGPKALRIGAAGLVGLASVAFSSLASHAGPGLRESVSFLFRSRLPIVSPASVLAVVFLTAVVSRLLREGGGTERRALAAACFGTVLLLTNQQILTGWMISARSWEQYVNYPLLLLGGALWISDGNARALQAPDRRARVLAASLLALTVSVLVAAQLRVFSLFRDVNLKTFAMQQALEGIRGVDPRRMKLVLEEPELAPLLEFRMKGRLRCLIDYTDITRRIAPLAESEGNWGLRSPFKERLFEYFARVGRSPADVRSILSEEADRRSGFFSAFLFSLMDQWYPLTDDRKVREREIRAILPEIVQGYAVYLAADQRRGTSRRSSSRRALPRSWTNGSWRGPRPAALLMP